MNVLNTILKPDANGNCPLHGKPVWIAPGDVCSNAAPEDLRGNLEMCDGLSDDFGLSSHQLRCISDADVRHLWSYGLCHSSEEPLLAKDGRLICCSVCGNDDIPSCGGQCTCNKKIACLYDGKCCGSYEIK